MFDFSLIFDSFLHLSILPWLMGSITIYGVVQLALKLIFFED